MASSNKTREQGDNRSFNR